MLTFFTGWRRKAGCVTLAIAGVLMALWLRSASVKDTIRLPVSNGTTCFIVSNRSWVYWQAVRGHGDEQYANLIHRGAFHHASPADFYDYFTILEAEKLGVLFDHPRHGMRMNAWGAPYWAIVSPLTLLAACLPPACSSAIRHWRKRGSNPYRNHGPRRARDRIAKANRT